MIDGDVVGAAVGVQVTDKEGLIDIKEVGDHLVIDCEKFGIHKKITVLAKAFPINLHLGTGTSHDAIEVVMALLMLAVVNGPTDNQKSLQPLSQDIQEIIAEHLMETNKTPLPPTLVHTRNLETITKPYGTLTPFHNEMSLQANISVARVIFKAGSNTRGHNHLRTQESYYAEGGSARIILWSTSKQTDRSEHILNAGDYLLVPEHYYHDVQVIGKISFECLVIASPPFDVWDQFFVQEAGHDV